MTDEVQRYVDAIDPRFRPLFDRVHELVMSAYPEATVALSYRMPTYRVGPRRLYVGVWKHGLSIYGWRRGDSGFAARHPELVTTKGTVRLRPEAAAVLTDDDLRGLIDAALAD